MTILKVLLISPLEDNLFPAVFSLQASRRIVRVFQNWLMIKLILSFKLKTSHLYQESVVGTVIQAMVKDDLQIGNWPGKALHYT